MNDNKGARMFRLQQVIPNGGDPSLINEVSFAPDGRSFAAAFEYTKVGATCRDVCRRLRHEYIAHGLLIPQTVPRHKFK